MDFGDAFYHQDDSEVSIIYYLPSMTGKFQCTLTKPGSIRSISVMAMCTQSEFTPNVIYSVIVLKSIRRLQLSSLELKGQ